MMEWLDWLIDAVVVLLVFGSFFFVIFPSVRKHPDRALLKGAKIAHRGLHDVLDDSPENSLRAFELAAQKGYWIENDIHLTADGEVVVFHDDTLNRMCGVSGKPEEKTLQELKELRLGGTDEQIPTLQECLDTVHGRVPILIEFKSISNDASVKLCTVTDAILQKYAGKYLIQSFSPFVCRWYRKNRPDICRGQLSSGFYREGMVKQLLGCLFFNFLSRPDFISYDYRCRNNFFRRITGWLGALQVCWTLRSQEEFENAQKEFSTYIFELFLPKDIS